MATAALDNSPVSLEDRVETVDVLRGFALFGILLVNFWGAVGETYPRVDAAVDAGLDLLISSSFYPLFSFLFGLGFGIQLLRSRARGTGVSHLYVRRLLILFLIGTAHAVLIWDGDILVLYSVLGLLLIPFAKLPTRPLFAVALFILALNLDPLTIRERIAGESAPEVARAGELVQGVRDEQTRMENSIQLRDGSGPESSYAADLRIRWGSHGNNLVGLTSPDRLFASEILLAFLLGLLVGRERWIERASSHRRAWWVVLGAGVLLTTAGNLLLDDARVPEVFENFAWLAANPGLTAAYIAGIVLLMIRNRRTARLLRVFSPAGRMALTIYLMQSIVMTWLFLPYGAGLNEPNTTVWVLLNVFFFFGIQIPFAHAWLRRFHYGPAEWVWRSLTYGEPQPFRRRSVAAAPGVGFAPIG